MEASKVKKQAPVYIEVDCLKRSDITTSKTSSLRHSKERKSQNSKMTPKFVIMGNRQSHVHEYEEVDPIQLQSLSSNKEDCSKAASSKPSSEQVQYENINVMSKKKEGRRAGVCAKHSFLGLFVMLLVLCMCAGLAVVTVELFKLKTQLSSYQQECISTFVQLQECTEMINATEFLSQFISNGTSVFNLLVSLYHDLNGSIADIEHLNQTYLGDYALLKRMLALSSNRFTQFDQSITNLSDTYLRHYSSLSQMLTSSVNELSESHNSLQQSLMILDSKIEQLNLTHVQDYDSTNETLDMLKLNYSLLNQSFSSISNFYHQVVQNLTILESNIQLLNSTHVQDYSSINDTLGMSITNYSLLNQRFSSISDYLIQLQQNLMTINSEIQQLNSTHVQDHASINDMLGMLRMNYTLLNQRLAPLSSFYFHVLQSLDEPVAPADSCATILSFHPSSPSGYYWVRDSNGSALRVYCDMTLSCGGVTGGWARVVHLNVSESSDQCPGNLRYRSDVMLCGIRVTTVPPVCSSETFQVGHLQYSSVCGQIVGYRGGSPDAFHTERGIDDVYVDGISLTYGSPRQHIWTLAAATDSTSNSCPCSGGGSSTFSSQLAFVGEDYFCDTASSASSDGFFKLGNPLWDGAGCASADRCCMFNNPPWFYKQLLEPVAEDIEMRVCSDQVRGTEDIGIAALELYVQ